MTNQLLAAFDLYQKALHQTWQSLRRGWITILAVIGFLFLLLLAQQLAAPLGMAGGFLLGAVNALLVGATLSLIQQSIFYARTLTIKDVFDSFGHYFWDVIGVGFVLWLPLMALAMGIQQNPNGVLISYAVMLLIILPWTCLKAPISLCWKIGLSGSSQLHSCCCLYWQLQMDLCPFSYC